MRLALVSLALLLASAGAALACTCAPVVLERDLPRADGAFVGTVLERQEAADDVTLLFRVEQVYKGDIANRVEVVRRPTAPPAGSRRRWASGSGSCSSGMPRSGARGCARRSSPAPFSS